jgi:hypothetical protein
LNESLPARTLTSASRGPASRIARSRR